MDILLIIGFLCIMVNESGEYIFDDKKAEKLEIYDIETSNTETMYSTYITTLLDEKLWNSRDAYDTTHYLMVPMYYAFQEKNEEWIQLFTNHVEKFSNMSEGEKEKFEALPEVDKWQYLWWISNYLCLCVQYDYDIPQKTYDMLYCEMKNRVNSYTGNWESTENYSNMWETYEGLLSGKGYANEKSYSNVFTPLDLKHLAILCDLKYVQDNGKLTQTYDNENFEKAIDFANRIMTSRVTWYEDGTCQFQVGMWRDYPDYLFADLTTETEIENRLQSNSVVADVVDDTNHFMIVPLLLRSYSRVQQDINMKQYYEKLSSGISKTFVEKVLKKPTEDCPYYRLTNYMDGRNGFYRYGYHTDRIGYGPYQQSSEFLMGYWAFCSENDEISEAYAYTASRFPLDDVGKKVYMDPVTVRKRNPIFMMESYEQFLCYLASELK